MRVRLVEPAAAGIAQREPRAGRTLVRIAAASGDPHREPLSGAAGPKNNQTLALEPGVCGSGAGAARIGAASIGTARARPGRARPGH